MTPTREQAAQIARDFLDKYPQYEAGNGHNASEVRLIKALYNEFTQAWLLLDAYTKTEAARFLDY